jgi:uncharacterized damage-inducible protein DinB
MRRIYLSFLVLATLALLLASAAKAQDKPADKAPTASAALTSGARAEFLEEVAYYEQRFTRLAEAMPAEKFAWRPGEGVRSVGEVYAHIAAANYGIARALGTPLPADIDPKAIVANAADKAKTLQSLKDSFAHFKQAILSLSDADLDKPQKMFGHDTTKRGAFFLITGHLGEHLGQSIAYARMNGVVPPWSEEAPPKPAEKPKQ